MKTNNNMKKSTQIKKLVAGAAAACLAMALAVPSAFAAGTTTTIDNQGNDTVTISGTVEATVLTADVTLSAPFAIRPNEAAAADRFVSPTITVKNRSTVPVNLSVKSLKHTGNSPAVVNQDKYTDAQWATLGKAATKASIAMGLKYNGTDSAADTTVAEKSYWFPQESAQTGTKYLKQLAVNETLDMTMQAKHGLAWASNETLDYQMVFGLSMMD